MLRTVVWIIGAVVVFVGGSLFGLAAWARRGERKPDTPGVRTVAAFKGGEQFISASEQEDERDQGAAALGGGLLAALGLEMAKQGLRVEEADRDDYGWGVIVNWAERKPMFFSVPSTTSTGP